MTAFVELWPLGEAAAEGLAHKIEEPGLGSGVVAAHPAEEEWLVQSSAIAFVALQEDPCIVIFELLPALLSRL